MVTTGQDNRPGGSASARVYGNGSGILPSVSEFSRTRYDSDRAEWSQSAHRAALRVMYPVMCGVPASALTVVSCDSASASAEYRAMDYKRGIDKIIEAHTEGFAAPLCYTVQERFQKPKNAQYRNITITEWNEQSDLPSELYKIQAMYFVGAFLTEDAGRITEGVIVPVPSLLSALSRRAVPFDIAKRNDKGQRFLRITIDDLLAHGLCDYHFRDDALVLDRIGGDPFSAPVYDSPAYKLPDGRALFQHGECDWRYFPSAKGYKPRTTTARTGGIKQ